MARERRLKARAERRLLRIRLRQVKLLQSRALTEHRMEQLREQRQSLPPGEAPPHPFSLHHLLSEPPTTPSSSDSER